MLHERLIHKHPPSTQCREHKTQTKTQFPLAVTSNLGQTLSAPDTGGAHGSPQAAGQLGTSQRPPGTSAPASPTSTPDFPFRSGQQDRARKRASGPRPPPVFRAWFLPCPSLQLCSEDKNVHHAQNKHFPRPPGWEGSSEVGASTPTSSVSCVCGRVSWSHPEFSTRERSDQMEQCRCHRTRVHRPALWRHAHVRGESPRLHGKVAARHRCLPHL